MPVEHHLLVSPKVVRLHVTEHHRAGGQVHPLRRPDVAQDDSGDRHRAGGDVAPDPSLLADDDGPAALQVAVYVTVHPHKAVDVDVSPYRGACVQEVVNGSIFWAENRHWLLYVDVLRGIHDGRTDVDLIMEVGTGRNARVSDGPYDLPLGHVVALADADGVQVGIAGVDAVLVLDDDGKTECRVVAHGDNLPVRRRHDGDPQSPIPINSLKKIKLIKFYFFKNN